MIGFFHTYIFYSQDSSMQYIYLKILVFFINICKFLITVRFCRYVDVILNLIRIAGDYVSEEVWYRVIQIVINRDEVQGYAAKTVFEVSKIRYSSNK